MTKLGINGKIRKAKKQNPQFKNLICAVLRNIDTEQIEDVTKHGAACGFGNFIYYNDTVVFFRKYKKDIISLAKMYAEEFGQSLIEFVCSFNCLKGYNHDEIADGLYNPKSDETQVQNAMAWFALEEVCRMIIEQE